MNTRQFDLASLETYRDQAPDADSKAQRTALLEDIYEQSKDPTLEKLRVRLLDALKYGDIRAMDQIHQEVVAYASSTSFIKNTYNKMRKVSAKRAEIYVAKK